MSRKYKVIAKVDDERFVKYNVNNLMKFTAFLDRDFPDWRYFNVYQYKKDDSGYQIANFTKNNRPRSAFVSM